jgi:ribose transport system ATP-binding protein
VTAAPVLSIKALSKRFGGTQAVDAVSLNLHRGEVLALLGENGAGKSSLIKILANVYQQDSGTVALLGMHESQWRTLPKGKVPMAFIHQDLGLVEWMTVAENIALGMGFPKRFGLIDWSVAESSARRVLAHVGCDIDPRRRVFTLTRAEKSLLAIGRALDSNAKILVLDEPTASLPMADVQRLFGLLRRLRSEGVAMIYVSHRLDEIMDISDRAAVMRDGKLVGVCDTKKTTSAELVELIVGRKFEGQICKAKTPASDAEVVLCLTNIYTANAGPVNITARRGEVLGLIGLRGAGHEVVGRALFGLSEIERGSVDFLGKFMKSNNPAAAIARGIGFVAADRLEENLGVTLTVKENLFPNPALIFGKMMARLRRKTEDRQAENLILSFDVNPPTHQADIQNLSGGNQQKVVLARWMNLKKPLLILEEPTAGVDVGAKRQIYEILRQQAQTGVCVLVISTDFEEISNLCTRALVFRDGQVAHELTGEELTVARLLVTSSG